MGAKIIQLPGTQRRRAPEGFSEQTSRMHALWKAAEEAFDQGNWKKGWSLFEAGNRIKDQKWAAYDRAHARR